MKKRWKKNQWIVTALALMIAVAGYVSYTRGNFKDMELEEANADLTEDSFEVGESGEIAEEDIFTDTGEGIETAEADTTETMLEEEANPGETVMTSANGGVVEFAAEMKLEREQVRAKNKEMLEGIIDSKELTNEQKQDAVNQLMALTDIAEREAAAEMLLEAKGFKDVVVSITDEGVDVVLDMGEVTDAKRAQVEDIVKRKTNVSPEKIIITPIEH